jgi:hypothetical protein
LAERVATVDTGPLDATGAGPFVIGPQGQNGALHGDADLLDHVGASGLGSEALAIAALAFGVGERHGVGSTPLRHLRKFRYVT